MLTRNTKSKHKYFCLNCKDKNYLIECACGCGRILFRFDKWYEPKSFLKNHDKKFRDFSKIPKGQDHWNWKGGRYLINNYYYLYLPDYFSSDKQGRIPEHVYFFQEYHKCCMLPWGIVHHIEPVREGYCNNMPWNLMGVTKRNHVIIHHKGVTKPRKDKSGRKCSDPKCKDPLRIFYDRLGRERWFGNSIDGWRCKNCHQNKKYKERKQALQKLNQSI